LFHWVVFSGSEARHNEARRGASLFAGECAVELSLKTFRDGFLPYSGGEVKEFFEDLKRRVEPHLVLTHWRGDAHQDHRLISELTWNTFRNHLILEYEVPKYDGDMGRPNFYFPVDEAASEEKVTHLLEAFPSQRSKPWFDRRTFLGLMRLRGVEANAPSGYAEAYHLRKAVFEDLAGE
jgi:LmbE family N-acetylglucosaminyl deacetylase